MKRQYTLFFRNIKKTIRYAYYALRLKKGLDLFKVHVLGYDRKIIANNIMIYPDYALVFSEYWKLWHVKNYFFDMVHNYILCFVTQSSIIYPNDHQFNSICTYPYDFNILKIYINQKLITKIENHLL